tara:strand:- start:958 stop:1506 length:549 start_codon:yes stop_codon:yes gene_type:complete
MIHKSFSKTDLIEVISVFNIDIYNANNLSKLQLSLLLYNKIQDLESIRPDTELFMVNTKEELLELLHNKNPEKILSVKEKVKIMRFCKQVILYCNNNFDLSLTSLNTKEELYLSVEEISKYGYIPSVRRAIRLINNDSGLVNKIVPILSNRAKRDLELKKNSKNRIIYGLQIKHEKITLHFN